MTTENIVTIGGRPHDIRCPQSGRTDVSDCCKPMVAFTATTEERKRLEKWAWEQAAAHQRICAEAYDAKDESNGDIHNSLASAYTSLVRELHRSQEGRKA